MVAAAAGTSVNREILAAVNYWFRHVWETFWPLYPGVMLAAALSDNSLVAIVVFRLPLHVFMALAGAPLLRTIDRRMVDSPDGSAANAGCIPERHVDTGCHHRRLDIRQHHGFPSSLRPSAPTVARPCSAAMDPPS
jgi:hypothetical protein